MSPIPLYLLGGLGFGTGGVVPLGGIGDFTTLAGEVGRGAAAPAARPGVLRRRADHRACAAPGPPACSTSCSTRRPGVAVALSLGLGSGRGDWCSAGVTYISSSGIVAKVLADLGRLGNRETPVVLSILVFEDLAMAVYLPILTAVLIGVSFLGGLEAVGDLARRASPWCWWWRCGTGASSPRSSTARTARSSCSRCSALALLVAGFASALQVSAAVGAFLLGIAISGSTAENATRLLEPLRDLFAAVFFVVFGLNTDPASIPPVLGWAVVLAVATTLTKLATGWWAAQWQGIGPLGRARAGAALVARGEFSIVIAGLAVSLRGGAERAGRAGDGVRAAHGRASAR